MCAFETEKVTAGNHPLQLNNNLAVIKQCGSLIFRFTRATRFFLIIINKIDEVYPKEEFAGLTLLISPLLSRMQKRA